MFWQKKQEHVVQIALVERERCEECGGRYEVSSGVSLMDSETGEEVVLLEAVCQRCGYRRTFRLATENSRGDEA